MLLKCMARVCTASTNLAMQFRWVNNRDSDVKAAATGSGGIGLQGGCWCCNKRTGQQACWQHDVAIDLHTAASMLMQITLSLLRSASLHNFPSMLVTSEGQDMAEVPAADLRQPRNRLPANTGSGWPQLHHILTTP